MLDKENMLEEETEIAPTKKELWEENLLGGFFEKVTEIFPDLRFDSTGQQYRLCRLMMPRTPFPEITKAYSPQRLTVEDVCYIQEALRENKGQQWNVAMLPANNPVPFASCQTDKDCPLLKAASVPYMSIAVSSSRLPEAVDDNASTKLALCWNEAQDLPKHGRENLVIGDADEFFTIGLVVAPSADDVHEPSLSSSADIETKEDLKIITEDMAAPSSFTVMKEEIVSANDVPEEPYSEPWYKRIMNWFQTAPKAVESPQALVEGARDINENSEASQGSDTVASKSAVHSSLPLSSMNEEGFSLPKNSLEEHREIPENLSQGIESSSLQEDAQTEPVVDETAPETKTLLASLANWFHVAPREISPGVEVPQSAVVETPATEVQESSSESPKIKFAIGVVPLPELIDETQESDVVDESSINEEVSWLERLSDWARGDRFEKSNIEVSESYEHGKKEESSLKTSCEKSSADEEKLVADRLGDVERPDEAWEDIEDEMRDDDDETAKPGVMTRAFSTIHSLWQSAIGEAALTDKQKDLDESTDSCVTRENSDNSEPPS
jgi:hypothetical protein